MDGSNPAATGRQWTHRPVGGSRRALGRRAGPAVAGLLSRALGRRIRYEPVGLLRYRRELLDAGLDPTYVRVQMVINMVARLGLAATVTDTVPRLLGRPATPLATFVADHVASWR